MDTGVPCSVDDDIDDMAMTEPGGLLWKSDVMMIAPGAAWLVGRVAICSGRTPPGFDDEAVLVVIWGDEEDRKPCAEEDDIGTEMEADEANRLEDGVGCPWAPEDTAADEVDNWWAARIEAEEMGLLPWWCCL